MERRRVFFFISFVVLAQDAFAADSDDLVASLPGYGKLKNRQYAGFIPVNASYDHNLFYWFVEAATGNTPGKTPTLLWLNGGPGASSITGLLVENIGPLTLQLNGTLTENKHTWASSYNLMIFDNPVGAGFSYTSPPGYVTTEEQMRKEYYIGLSGFFKKHPEYKTNPLWVTGESYGGKYVPNVAYEIHIQGELPLQGVIIGNGMYSSELQYPAVPEFAYMHGLIDDTQYSSAKERLGVCLDLIKTNVTKAALYCEHELVEWIYSNSTDGGIFYYDVGIHDGSFFDDLTAAMSKYLNSAAVREALHVGDHFWVQADETGPVADALRPDFVTNQSMVMLELLLATGKYQVVNYNGVRDGSMCNHIGNLQALLKLKWSGQQAFQDASTEPFRVPGQQGVAGYVRSAGQLKFIKYLWTGHLVPMLVADTALYMLHKIVGEPAATEFVV